MQQQQQHDRAHLIVTVDSYQAKNSLVAAEGTLHSGGYCSWHHSVTASYLSHSKKQVEIQNNTLAAILFNS